MFQKFKSIDQAFQKVRLISVVSVLCSCLICGWVIWQSYNRAERDQHRLYVMINGEVFQAVAADEKDYLEIEARQHVKDLFGMLFNLDPDEKMIRRNMDQALYLGDGSVKRFCDNLKESDFITGIVSGNMIERIRIDTVELYQEGYPYAFRFRCYGQQVFTRASSETTRKLVSSGYLRRIHRSDDNSHGFLIERFEVEDNKDQQTKNR